MMRIDDREAVMAAEGSERHESGVEAEVEAKAS